MRKIAVLIFLFIVMAVNAEWVDLNESSTLFDYTSDRDDIISLQFQLDGYEIEENEISGKVYTKVSHPQQGSILEEGMPELPVFTVFIAVPNEGKIEMDYDAFQRQTLNNVAIYPQQEIDDNEKASGNFLVNSEYYSSGGVYPEQAVHSAGAMIMRDLRIFPVEIYPFRYNGREKQLEIISEIEISLRVLPEKGENEKRVRRQLSRAFDPIYRKMLINYDDIRDRDEFQPETILYIIKDLDDALATLEYLTEWRRQRGFNVVVATTSETGTSSNSIKNYIQDAYDNWDNPPDYLCFCGDASGTYGIPAWSNGDHGYTTLDGNDVFEDVILGRLSFESNSNFQVLVSKILSYEKEPYIGETEWYNSALLAGDPSISGPSMIFTCQSVKEMMLDYPDGFNDEDAFYEIYSGSFPTQINNAIDEGVSYMAYRGWLGMSSWNPGGHSNGYMMPFATLLTCGTGSWTYGTSDTETFMRQGSTALPSGAIGAVGVATAGTHSCFNNALTHGIYGGIFRDEIYTMGGAVTMGKNYLYYTFPQNPGGYVETYHDWVNLMGEACLELWTSVPQEMTTYYDPTVQTGSDFYEVIVEDINDEPVMNALACLSTEESDYTVRGYSDENGHILLELDGIEEGEYDLVVTAHNYIPEIHTVEVSDQNYNIDIESVEYNDLNGNNDGVINPGETIEITATFINSGTNGMIGLEGNLSLIHDYIQLQTSFIEIGELDSGESVTLTTPIVMDISESASGGMQGFLRLDIYDAEASDFTKWLRLDVEGSNLYVIDHSVVGGGVITPGIESEIYFTIENLGGVAGEDISAELNSSTPRLMVSDSLGYFGSIAPGGTEDNSGDTFTVSASTLIVPGSQIPVELILTDDDGNFQTATYMLPVGEVDVSDPLGPDEYGYWCFDDEDIGYDNCPEFDWIEIDGMGTSIPLYDNGDDGDVSVVDLPDDFNFSFYGEEYDEITVCSNGWIAPGIHEAANFMNHPLPAPQGVNPMIAVFWDDLDVGGSGDVLYYYDTSEHIFIVEWSDIHNGDTGAAETFEVILYDTEYYTTMTDDSLIKMQYLEVNNNNAGSYPYNHGQFCTIGLESDGAETGLCYTFNNEYPDAAKELEDEMAILFSPPQYPETGPYLELSAFQYISGDDQFIEAGESVTLSVTIANQGVDTAENISLELTTTDPYVTITEGNAGIETISSMETEELIDVFEFEVSETVPDNHDFSLILEMTSGEDFWSNTIDLTAHWINAFFIEQDSINVEIGMNQTNEASFVLENVSAQTVDYYLRFNEEIASRDISGSYVECSATEYEPNNEYTWNFIVYNNSVSNEWVSDVWLSFPPGVTVLDAGNAFGGTGGDMEWDGTTGDGVTVNWHGETANEWGVLHDGESADWSVDVSIGENFASDLQIGWAIEGDGYGAEPHYVEGEVNIDFFINWVSLNTSYGTLPAGESDEITIYFDSEDLEPGEYECSINVLSDSWFEDLVNIYLTVNPTDDSDNNLPSVEETCIVSPNPFNPSTEILFTVAEAGDVEISVYNVKGQKVITLLSEVLESGEHKLHWDSRNDKGRKCSSGLYLLQYETKNSKSLQKILLLK